MTVAEGGGIFVSYRRQETGPVAGRLYDRLADRFGKSHVFIDVDAIEPGVDFAEEIFRAVAACRVLLAIIGPSWLTAADERGSRRLEDPQDWVRLEIQAALTRGVRVIPILVEGAVMPAPDDLPDSLAGLARRHALRIRHESFGSDAGRLMAAVEQVLASPGTAAVSSSGPVQDNAVRVTRFLADAGRIANSITVGYWKAAALFHIGEALAPTDPDRAARLFTGGERIANSITDESAKADALSNIAEALALTDPDRAARLCADAGRIASSVTDASEKAEALYYVAKAVAPTDPDRAERIANSITGVYWKAAALINVGEALARTDPDRAAQVFTDAGRIANFITDELPKARVLNNIAKAVAPTDPDRAERIAYSIPVRFLGGAATAVRFKKAAAMCSIAKAVAPTDRDRAARLFTDAERIANSITDESTKAEALSDVAEALATTSA